MNPEPTATTHEPAGDPDLIPNIQEKGISVERVADCYQDTSPYNPKVYKCVGYGGELYEYFDRRPGKDGRFTIDLEEGSTDRLVVVNDIVL